MLHLGTQTAISTGPERQPPIGGFMHQQWRKSITTLAFVLAWAISAVLVLWMLYDWFKTDTSYSEEQLTSSREGEIEAVSEKHKV